MIPVFSKYHAANVSVIKTLKPVVRPLFYEGLIRLAYSGIPVRLTSGGRTVDEQHAEFLKGRPWLVGGKKGKKVTWVDGLDSWHCWDLAIDICPLRQIGNLTVTAYDKLAQVAYTLKEIGIENPWPKHDGAHFMYTDGKTIEDMKDGIAIRPPVFPLLYPLMTGREQAAFVKQRDLLLKLGILPL